jgi:hypothetical protein
MAGLFLWNDVRGPALATESGLENPSRAGARLRRATGSHYPEVRSRRAPKIVGRGGSPDQTIRGPTGRLFGRLLRFLIDRGLRQRGKGLVGFLFLLQGLIEKRDRILQPQLVGPGHEGPIARDFVMLDRLRRR